MLVQLKTWSVAMNSSLQMPQQLNALGYVKSTASLSLKPAYAFDFLFKVLRLLPLARRVCILSSRVGWLLLCPKAFNMKDCRFVFLFVVVDYSLMNSCVLFDASN